MQGNVKFMSQIINENLFSLPLPLSAEDDLVLVNLMPEIWFGIWLDVIVSESNVYKDDNGNLLNYEANLKEDKQGTDENNFI